MYRDYRYVQPHSVLILSFKRKKKLSEWKIEPRALSILGSQLNFLPSPTITLVFPVFQIHPRSSHVLKKLFCYNAMSPASIIMNNSTVAVVWNMSRYNTYMWCQLIWVIFKTSVHFVNSFRPSKFESSFFLCVSVSLTPTHAISPGEWPAISMCVCARVCICVQRVSVCTHVEARSGCQASSSMYFFETGPLTNWLANVLLGFKTGDTGMCSHAQGFMVMWQFELWASWLSNKCSPPLNHVPSSSVDFLIFKCMNWL